MAGKNKQTDLFGLEALCKRVVPGSRSSGSDSEQDGNAPVNFVVGSLEKRFSANSSIPQLQSPDLRFTERSKIQGDFVEGMGIQGMKRRVEGLGMRLHAVRHPS